jgi:AraC family transcriptional regulator
MAAACGLSSGFFLRAFKAATGQAPHQFLLARRLIEARRLLEQTGAGAAEIAALTGFCSQAHMTTAFRRALGVTPAAYRAGINRAFASPKPSPSHNLVNTYGQKRGG